MHILIDRKGHAWSPDDPRLHRMLDYRGSFHELTSFVVTNMGWISVRTNGPRRHVHCRPGSFSAATFETCLKFIHAEEATRFSLQLDIPGQPFEMFREVDDLIARLEDLSREANGERPYSFFTAEQQSTDHLKLAGLARLTGIWNFWNRHRHRPPKKWVRGLLENPLAAECLLVKVSPDDVPITLALPEYVTFWGDTDLSGLLDKSMTDHPDASYAGAAAQGFVESRWSSQPRLELVNAFVQDSAGRGHRMRYTRLILPWSLSDGSVLLSGVSMPRAIRKPVPAESF